MKYIESFGTELKREVTILLDKEIISFLNAKGELFMLALMIAGKL